MKSIEDIAGQIAIDADMYCEKIGWQRIDLEIACYKMAKQIQQWIPIEEELPVSDNKDENLVLVKGYFNLGEKGNLKFIRLTKLRFVDSQGTPIWNNLNDDENEGFFDIAVTHWRPIEYK